MRKTDIINTFIDWLILTASQPILAYSMPRGFIWFANSCLYVYNKYLWLCKYLGDNIVKGAWALFAL